MNTFLSYIEEEKKMKGKDPCWNNYEMIGMKNKNGRKVPNCVPKEEADVEENFVSHAQRKAVWATKKDGGKGHPDNKKKMKEEVQLDEEMSHSELADHHANLAKKYYKKSAQYENQGNSVDSDHFAEVGYHHAVASDAHREAAKTGNPEHSKEAHAASKHANGYDVSESVELQTEEKHRIQVTISDPNNTMVSKRGEKIQKHVRLAADDKESAVAKAKEHYKKQGYKVHGAEHVGMIKEGKYGAFRLGSGVGRFSSRGRAQHQGLEDPRTGLPLGFSNPPKKDEPKKDEPKKVKEEVEELDEAIRHEIAGAVGQFIGNKIDPVHGEILKAHGKEAYRQAAYHIRKTVKDVSDAVTALHDKLHKHLRTGGLVKEEEVKLDEISQNTALNAYAQRAARAAKTGDKKDHEKADKTIARIGKKWTSDEQRRAWNRADKLIDKQANEETELEEEEVDEATYQGRKVQLNKPMPGDVKKSKVYVDPDGDGKAKKVEFGDPNMSIKKHIPARKKSFRARHNCDNPGPKDKARYWSCKAW